MKELPWDDDDVNAQPKFTLQRADLYNGCAEWAGRMAEMNRRRFESGEIANSTIVEVFRKMQTYYLEQRDAARANARLMWSS